MTVFFIRRREDDLLATLNFFFKKCQEHGLKLHASKCVLFASTVRYCGRLITKDGVRFDPKNMEALQTMQDLESFELKRALIPIASLTGAVRRS
jgi:hypothetical protein